MRLWLTVLLFLQLFCCTAAFGASNEIQAIKIREGLWQDAKDKFKFYATGKGVNSMSCVSWASVAIGGGKGTEFFAAGIYNDTNGKMEAYKVVYGPKVNAKQSNNGVVVPVEFRLINDPPGYGVIYSGPKWSKKRQCDITSCNSSYYYGEGLSFSVVEAAEGAVDDIYGYNYRIYDIKLPPVVANSLSASISDAKIKFDINTEMIPFIGWVSSHFFYFDYGTKDGNSTKQPMIYLEKVFNDAIRGNNEYFITLIGLYKKQLKR